MESVAKVYFDIRSENINLTFDIFKQYLDIDPTKFDYIYSRGEIPKCTHWSIGTENIKNPDMLDLITNVFNKIFPLKNRLILLKNDFPDIHYFFEIVIEHGDTGIGFTIENHILSFLSEICAILDVDQYNIK